ncbi:hypothetical protein [Lacisediminimonas profundi]|uniref:hypothetical protein n=1 Tax=Lacisediminimonas profundi TaxID=2603856 RepID=UPI00124B55F0|nr:hypothetical protein [Lacisediminimonas profundi]
MVNQAWKKTSAAGLESEWKLARAQTRAHREIQALPSREHAVFEWNNCRRKIKLLPWQLDLRVQRGLLSGKPPGLNLAQVKSRKIL